MNARFVTVLVEEHESLPEGCCMRFKIVDEPRPVRLVRHEPEGSTAASVFLVEAPRPDGAAETAWAATVEDSGAGTSVLVYGGSLGLRLRPRDGGEAIAEAYLLLAPDAVLHD
jgi:hypothetical protein